MAGGERGALFLKGFSLIIVCSGMLLLLIGKRCTIRNDISSRLLSFHDSTTRWHLCNGHYTITKLCD